MLGPVRRSGGRALVPVGVGVDVDIDVLCCRFAGGRSRLQGFTVGSDGGIDPVDLHCCWDWSGNGRGRSRLSRKGLAGDSFAPF